MGSRVCQADTCGAEDHGKVAIAHGQRGQVRESVRQLLDEGEPPAPGAELVGEGKSRSAVPAKCGLGLGRREVTARDGWWRGLPTLTPTAP